jgi:hypothetical protein
MYARIQLWGSFSAPRDIWDDDDDVLCYEIKDASFGRRTDKIVPDTFGEMIEVVYLFVAPHSKSFGRGENASSQCVMHACTFMRPCSGRTAYGAAKKVE